MDFPEICIKAKINDLEDEKKKEHTLVQSDFFMYSGEIFPALETFFYDFIIENKKHDNLSLVLTTYGGDPDAAFKTVKLIRRFYKKFTIIIPGNCKSAGTLLALGADEIVMCHLGEFGPLDVQIYRPDEFLQMSSGLTISQSLDSIGDQAFSQFEEMFLKIRSRSDGIITTKTAAEISEKLIIGLYSPITDKIDPSRLGELYRSSKIALHYGLRLGVPENILNHLIKNYPSHSFAILFDEARTILNNVREPDDFEHYSLFEVSDLLNLEYKYPLLRFPSDKNILGKIYFDFSQNEEQPEEVKPNVLNEEGTQDKEETQIEEEILTETKGE